MKTKKLVSVIVPCYNQAEYLPEALDSVSAQTYSNWECVIVNDGSPDCTEKIALSYCNKDVRFKYIKQENKGVAAARNFGIANSNGEYILPLDADDKIAPEYISKAVPILESNPKIKIVECEVQTFGEHNGIYKRQPYSFKHLLLFNGLVVSSVFRRIDFDRIGKYDEVMHQEDWDFWIKFLADGGEVYRLPTVCFYYRHLSQSRCHSFSEKIKDESLQFLYEKHIDLYFREFGAPQKYIAGGMYFDIEKEKIMNSPRVKIANILFYPVDLFRRICDKISEVIYAHKAKTRYKSIINEK